MRALLTLILVATLVASPGASASWQVAGQREPDTREDLEGGWMHIEAATTEGLYFNAFLTLPAEVVNPNSGLLGSRILPAPAAHHRALLGLWLDCNGDEVIGQAEGGVQEYRAELLDDAGAARCPAGGLHNDGQWVAEMIGVGKVDPCEYADDATRTADCPGVDAFHANEHVRYDIDSYVWGDHGRPTDRAITACPGLPAARGTTASTGGLLRAADCRMEHQVATFINNVDDALGTGLGFDDPRDPQAGDSPLDQALPLRLIGDADHDGQLDDDADAQPSATVWDCQAPATAARDPTANPGERGALSEIAIDDPSGGALTGPFFPLILTGYQFEDEDGDPATPGTLRIALADEQGGYAYVPVVAPRADAPTDGSSWRALAQASGGPTGDCDATRIAGQPSPAAAIESGAETRADRKDRADFTFTFYDGHRGLNPNIDPVTGPRTPSDGGTLFLRQGRGGAGPLWSATSGTDQDPQVVDRTSLAPSGRSYFSYYASVGESTLSSARVPAAHPGSYGAEACQDDTHGWQCDATRWWAGRDGGDETPRYARGERLGRVLGDAYHLRDTDCYDGSLIAETGLQASLVALTSAGPCPSVT